VLALTRQTIARQLWVQPAVVGAVAATLVLGIGCLALLAHLALAKPTTTTITPPAQPATLRRTATAVYLDGLESNAYGNSVINGMTIALRGAGEQVSYDDLMGWSGAAFRFYLRDPEWCPSSPFSLDRAKDLMQVVGRTLTEVRTDSKDPASLARRREAIIASIDNGMPVLFLAEECGVILGYQPTGETFFYRPYGYTLDRWKPLEPKDWNWAWVGIISPKRVAEPMARREAAMRSLRLALELSSPTSRPDAPGQRMVGGLPAYQLWVEQLVDEPRFAMTDKAKREQVQIGNAWMLAVLLDARLSAARYLHDAAREVPEATAQHVKLAGEAYQREAAALETARPIAPFPWQNRAWTATDRREQSRILKQALEQERQALAEIRAAVGPVTPVH
jgi:hypothetical protein